MVSFMKQTQNNKVFFHIHAKIILQGVTSFLTTKIKVTVSVRKNLFDL